MNKIFVIDLFAGAGGVTTGIHMANPNVQVVYCVNHDPNAIASHYSNHPNVIHAIEDIKVLAMMDIKLLVRKLRRDYPGCEIHLWASLECTNHSRAKGGLPRDQDSRTLAEHLFRYIEAINPDKIWIENVIEFMIWGPLDSFGKPIPELKGIDFNRWKNNVQKYGYNYDHRILNAADFGAYTSRKRYFAQFSRWGMRKPVWPIPTHGKNLLNHNAVRDVLNFTDEGKSIFLRNKPLSEATLKRILAGIEKFIIPNISHNNKAFLTKYYSTGSNIASVNEPCGTVTTKDRFAFIQTQYGNSTANGIDRPSGTLATVPKQNLVIGRFLMNPQFNSKGASIYKPSFTLIARMDKSPPYLITTSAGQPKQIPITSPTMQKIIDYMFQYNIADISMRMLQVEELLQIQGFPKNYKLVGTVADKKKFIGNAVECNQAKVLFDADYQSLINNITI